MYAGWTKTRHGGKAWNGVYAQPISAALHSGLSPVLASLDIFNANYLVNQQVKTDLYLTNDSWHDAKIHVELLLTAENPQCLPKAACFAKPLARQQFDFTVKADSMRTVPVTWKLPRTPGQYWLTARTTGLPGDAVLSQRFVRANAVPTVTKYARMVLAGGDAAATAFLTAKGFPLGSDLKQLVKDDVVLIWDATKLEAADKATTEALRAFAAAGGKISVLCSAAWPLKDLCDVSMAEKKEGWLEENLRYNRAFPYEKVESPVLKGILPESLQRWNGVPGLVALAPLQGPALEKATKLAWVRQPENHVVLAEVPQATGGSILFCQFDIKSHLDKTSDQYDPVAEQMLLNIIGR